MGEGSEFRIRSEPRVLPPYLVGIEKIKSGELGWRRDAGTEVSQLNTVYMPPLMLIG